MNPQGTPDLFYGPKDMNWPMKQIQGFPWAVPSQRDSPRVEKKKTQKMLLWLYGIYGHQTLESQTLYAKWATSKPQRIIYC